MVKKSRKATRREKEKRKKSKESHMFLSLINGLANELIVKYRRKGKNEL